MRVIPAARIASPTRDPFCDEEGRARRDILDRLARSPDIEHLWERRMPQPRKLLELIEQHPVCRRADLQRSRLRGLRIDDLPYPAKRPTADQLGNAVASEDRFASRQHRHMLMST